MVNEYRFRSEDLKEYIGRFLTHFDVPREDASIVGDALITADLRGVHSHGIGRLHTYYGDRLRAGLINPQTQLRLIRETQIVTVFDAQNGLGQVAGFRAMKACIKKAADTGVSIATVRNSNHFGIAGYYAMMALEHDMIGISLTNSQPLIAPTYGNGRILGTNPIAVAVPAGEEKPYVLDMATSVVPMGKISFYQEKEEAVPLGWGMDGAGAPTRDPHVIHDGGCLFPLGGTDVMRGYKGYGLALLVDILSGVLAGAAYGTNIGSPGSVEGPPVDIGHFFMAIDVNAFQPVARFKTNMDMLIEQLKAAPKALGHDRIFIHGEKEFERMEDYRDNGIPLIEAVVRSLRGKGEEVGVPFNLSSFSKK